MRIALELPKDETRIQLDDFFKGARSLRLHRGGF